MKHFLGLILVLCSTPALSGALTYKQQGPGLWIYLSFARGIPSNGLVLETKAGVVIIDTPWNDANTDELLNMD